MISFFFTVLVGCSIKTELVIIPCYERAYSRGESRRVIKKIKQTEQIKLFGILFESVGENIEPKKKFSKSEITIIDSIYNMLANNVTDILSNKIQKPVKLDMRISLNVSTSCREGKFRISPFLLQTIFKSSIQEAIRRNNIFFKSENIIKTPDHFLKIIKSHNCGNFFRNYSDEEDKRMALEIIRITSFVSSEYITLVLFIFGHELFHILTECEIGVQYEYYADMLGIEAFHSFTSDH